MNSSSHFIEDNDDTSSSMRKPGLKASLPFSRLNFLELKVGELLEVDACMLVFFLDVKSGELLLVFNTLAFVCNGCNSISFPFIGVLLTESNCVFIKLGLFSNDFKLGVGEPL